MSFFIVYPWRTFFVQIFLRSLGVSLLNILLLPFLIHFSPFVFFQFCFLFSFVVLILFKDVSNLAILSTYFISKSVLRKKFIKFFLLPQYLA